MNVGNEGWVGKKLKMRGREIIVGDGLCVIPLVRFAFDFFKLRMDVLLLYRRLGSFGMLMIFCLTVRVSSCQT